MSNGKRRMGGAKYCYICKTEIDTKMLMKDHQLAEHRDDIKGTRVSNRMEDVVRTACKLCGAHIKVTGMRGHTKANHQVNITQYKQQYDQTYYDLVELILHQCGICEEYLLLDSDYIAAHLKSKHDITHGNYNAKYMQLCQNSGQMKKGDGELLAIEGPPVSSITQKDTKIRKKKGNKELAIEGPPGPSVTDKESESHIPFQTTDLKKQKNPSLEKDFKILEEKEVSIKSSGTMRQKETVVREHLVQIKHQNSKPSEKQKEIRFPTPELDVSVESLRKFLASISTNEETMSCPTLELLLNLDI